MPESFHIITFWSCETHLIDKSKESPCVRDISWLWKIPNASCHAVRRNYCVLRNSKAHTLHFILSKSKLLFVKNEYPLLRRQKCTYMLNQTCFSHCQPTADCRPRTGPHCWKPVLSCQMSGYRHLLNRSAFDPSRHNEPAKFTQKLIVLPVRLRQNYRMITVFRVQECFLFARRAHTSTHERTLCYIGLTRDGVIQPFIINYPPRRAVFL